MTLDLASLPDDLDVDSLSDDDAAALKEALTEIAEQTRRESSILFYKPVSAAARRVHETDAKVIGIFAGNRASKTETMFAEATMLSTGVWPPDLDAAMRPKFRGPIKVRVDLQSLTTTLHSAILPKLQFWSWNGLKPQGGPAGHWGWIPKNCLVGSDWEKSWSEKLRQLRVLCRDPNDPDRIMGESLWQFVSHDMDAQDLASGEFDLILHDEPPPWAHWRENQARVISVGGRLMLAMTWPDDASIPVEWIFDEVWEKGMPGSMKDPTVECIELDTFDNPHIDQESVHRQADAWDATTRAVRIKGQPIRFSNRIHPLFTDVMQCWSFQAGKPVVPRHENGKIYCPETGSDDLEPFCHVADFEHSRSWPVVYLLDPHPRKPHFMLWVQVDPTGDLSVIAEMEIDADPAELRDGISRLEGDMGLNVVRRLGDPNMLQSPASADRHTTWLDAFRAVGLALELADDSDVGRGRLNAYLKPDGRTRRPRIVVHRRCRMTIFQIKRFTWQDYKRRDERDLKQVPREKYDDAPALLKYLLNTDPSYSMLSGSAPVLHMGTRKRGYG